MSVDIDTSTVSGKLVVSGAVIMAIGFILGSFCIFLKKIKKLPLDAKLLKFLSLRNLVIASCIVMLLGIVLMVIGNLLLKYG